MCGVVLCCVSDLYACMCVSSNSSAAAGGQRRAAMPPKVKVEEGFGLDDAELARLEADALETMMSWERSPRDV